MLIKTAGSRRKQKRQRRRRNWNKWFAWRPVVVHVCKDGSKEWAWFRKVERRGKYVRYEGQLIGNDSPSGLVWAILWTWKYRSIEE